MSNQLLEVLTEAADVKPILDMNGKKLYTFDGSVKKSAADMLNKKAGFAEAELGHRELGPSQDNYRRINKKHAAVDPSALFNNRYKKETGSKAGGKPTAIYTIVTDYKALQFQQTGQVHDNIVGYQVKVSKDEKGVLTSELVRLVQVSGQEFVNDFTRKLSPRDMQAILPQINKMGSGNNISVDTLSL